MHCYTSSTAIDNLYIVSAGRDLPPTRLPGGIDGYLVYLNDKAHAQNLIPAKHSTYISMVYLHPQDSCKENEQLKKEQAGIYRKNNKFGKSLRLKLA